MKELKEILSKLNVEKTKEIDSVIGDNSKLYPTTSVYELDYENFLKSSESKYIHDFMNIFNIWRFN